MQGSLNGKKTLQKPSSNAEAGPKSGGHLKGTTGEGPAAGWVEGDL